jgi:hypothetical protein
MSDQLELYRALFLGIAAICLYVGVRGFMGKRPFIFRSWLLPAIGLLGVLPRFGMSDSPGPERYRYLMPLLNAFYAALLGSAFWVATPSLGLRGYVLLGVTPAALSRALRHALAKLGFRYEEQGPRIVVSEQGFELVSSVQSLVGMAQLRATQTPGKLNVSDVVDQMSEYFLTSEVESNRTVFGYCVTMGLTLMAIAWALPR